MVVDRVSLSPVPRSFGPSPVEQRPRQQRKHGRQYSVQLDIGQKPIDHEDSESEQEGKDLPLLPAGEQHDPSPSSSSPSHNNTLKEADDSQDPVSQHLAPSRELSPEELFALRFGYGVTVQHPVIPVAPYEEEELVALPSHPRPRSIQRRLTPFSDEEEGNLVVLPPPPLLRPASFWRNTRRSALHTPSLHLVRRATFLAAGLALDKPVCDLSAFAVESRITIGKTKGLSGSAGVPVGWGVFG